MKRFLCIVLGMVLAEGAFCNDIFRDLAFSDESNEHSDNLENIADIKQNAIEHRLLDVLGEHLLSNDKRNNMLAQVLINDRGSLIDFNEKLEALLKPFVNETPKLAKNVDWFIKKVFNAIQPLDTKENLDWNDIKAIIPTLQIFCKQLIDQVTTIF